MIRSQACSIIALIDPVRLRAVAGGLVFFSSRRRHTSFSRDWSSDVCSSDLTDAQGSFAVEARVPENVPFGEQPVSATDMCGAAATAALEVRWGGWPPLVAFDVGQIGRASCRERV